MSSRKGEHERKNVAGGCNGTVGGWAVPVRSGQRLSGTGVGSEGMGAEAPPAQNDHTSFDWTVIMKFRSVFGT